MAITKRGNTWQYTLNLGIIDGKRERITKGGFKTKKECEMALTEEQIKYNKTNRIKKVSNITVKQYLNIYYDEYVLNNCKYKTCVTYKEYIEKHINPVLGNYKLKDLIPRVLYDFIIGLSKEYSKNHCDSIRTFLNNALRFAIFPKELIFSNPFDNIKFKNINYCEGREKIILTKNDMEKIFDYLEIYPHYYLPVQIMYRTGMRAGEVCGLTWNNVDLNNKLIKVRKQIQRRTGEGYVLVDLKTKSSIRDISIDDFLVDLLKQKKKEYNKSGATHNYVCTCKDINRMIGKDRITSRMASLIKKNVCPFNCHAVRHLHATMLIENGADIKDVSVRLGHKNTNITYNIYVELSQRQKDKTKHLINSIF